MGSPVSVVVVDIFMEDLKQSAMSSAPTSVNPKIWKRYINDSFKVVRKAHEMHCLITWSVKFSDEPEAKGSIPFLDIFISYKEEGSVKK